MDTDGRNSEKDAECQVYNLPMLHMLANVFTEAGAMWKSVPDVSVKILAVYHYMQQSHT